MPSQPWHNWHHCIVSTYGTWLPGDPRGWHERHHKRHIPSDYKHRAPPDAASLALNQYAQSLMPFDSYAFAVPDLPRVGALLLASFAHQKAPCIALAILPKGIHALVQCCDPRIKMGRAKAHATFHFAPAAPGVPRFHRPLWEKRSLTKPIQNHDHHIETYHYILNHYRQGAWITWTDAQGTHQASPRL